MKVFVVFETKSNGSSWSDSVHSVQGTKEGAEKALKEVKSGYITDYDI